MRTKSLTVILLGAVGVVAFYYGYKLGDRSKPYSRVFGVADARNPAECDLPPGPVPAVIRASGGDCVGPDWKLTHHKHCNVTPSNPYVRRKIIDRDGNVTNLPLVLSQFVDGQKPVRTYKTFIQPPLPPGWVSYRASVCFECTTDAFLMEGMINPLHRVAPVCVNELSIEYRVEATIKE